MASVQVGVDLSKIGKFAKTLDKQSATALRKAVRKAVTTAGDSALKRAKENAAWSTGKSDGEGHPRAPIADAISLRTSFGARSSSVKMRTDKNKAPQAYFYERGSTGSGGKYIKHPVFAKKNTRRYDEKKNWKVVLTRPFFYRAVWDHRDELKTRLGEQISEAVRELGYEI